MAFKHKIHASTTRAAALMAALALAACANSSSSNYVREKGSFTDATTTRSSKDATCNAELRIGNRAGFATAYTYDSKSRHTVPNFDDPDSEYVLTSVRSGALARMAMGLDPDTSNSFRTDNVWNWWGDYNPDIDLDGASGAYSKYTKTASFDGEIGLYVFIEDDNGSGDLKRSAYLNVMISQPGIARDIEQAYRAADALGYVFGPRVTFQFDSGQPLVFEGAAVNVRLPDIVQFRRFGGQQTMHFLLANPQPSQRLTVSITDSASGRVFATRQSDISDARAAYSALSQRYTEILRSGCAL